MNKDEIIKLINDPNISLNKEIEIEKNEIKDAELIENIFKNKELKNE